MHEFQSYQEIQTELDYVIEKSYHPEFLVADWFNGKLYFNPITNCGLYYRIDKEYGDPIHTWFLNIIKLLFFVKDVSRNILFTSPDPIYQNIKCLYIQNNIPIPKIFYKFENHIL